MSGSSDYTALLPEGILMAGAVITLLAGSFLPRARQGAASWFAMLTACVSAAAAALAASAQVRAVFTGSYRIDTATTTARILIPLATAVIILIGRREQRGTPRESETAALLLLAALGTVILAGADDLLILATGFLLATIPLYALIGLSRTPAAAEASMKTYLLGAIFGITLLAGITVLASIGDGTAYTQLRNTLPHAPRAALVLGVVGVLAGLLFKAGAAPGHFWIPDAAEAAPVSIAAFLTTVPKLGALIALGRLSALIPPTTHTPLLLGILAAISMTLGTLAAFWQRNLKRLLGWSTIGQVGFLLIPITVIHTPGAEGALLTYLACYSITNLALFAALTALPGQETLPSWNGTIRRHPALAGVVIIGLLSLVGTPPTVIFAAKLAAFTAAWHGGYAWLAVLGAAISVASLFYALRWITTTIRGGLHTRSTPPPASSRSVSLAQTTAILLGILTLAATLTAPALLTQ